LICAEAVNTILKSNVVVRRIGSIEYAPVEALSLGVRVELGACSIVVADQFRTACCAAVCDVATDVVCVGVEFIRS